MILSKRDLKKVLDLRAHTLTDWIRKGVITPSGARAKGAGTRNVFTEEDTYRAHLVEMLVKMGVPPSKAVEYQSPGDWCDFQDAAWLVIQKEVDAGCSPHVGSMTIYHDPHPIQLKGTASRVIAVDLAKIKSEVDARLAKITQGEAK